MMEYNVKPYLIELLAYWEGRVNVTRLKHVFPQSRQNLTKDLQHYRDSHPKNLEYSAFKQTED